MSETVLIVDDSLTVRMDLSEAFEASGFRPVVCDSLAGARAAMTDARPCLAIVDVMLPDGDGIDLIASWRADPDLCALPVILLSAETEVADRIRGLTQGADEYVGKPYDVHYVVARAHDLLSARASDPEADAPMILLIDDSATFRGELGARLREAGYRPRYAQSGEDGLRRAAQLRPHAIVVDGIMPGMDGTAVIRQIRADPGLQATPCLMLTGSEHASNEVTALDAGADAYARKGEGTAVVLARIAAMLRARDGSMARGGGTLTGPKRILAIDDSPSYLELLSHHLQADGYEVVKGHSGEQALELLAFERVDCILLDLVMPGLSGHETCRRIKSDNVLRGVPVLILTSLDDAEAMIDGINAGADDYVTKSPNFDVLKARVRAQLRRKQIEDEHRRVREGILRSEAEARSARELAETRAELLDQLERKNADLLAVNDELKMFAYSVSHDLRQPLRAMDGFSRVLLTEYGPQLDQRGQHYLERIRAGAQRMAQLIDGLLTLSRVTRKPLARERVDLSEIARGVLQRLQDATPDREVAVVVADGLVAHADPHLIESVLENLLGNAWKFTSQRPDARIEVGADAGDPRTYFVRDNGAGFDEQYAHKLFGPFQRLHNEREFPGTGIGLATVQRIVHRHGGRIWAQSSPGEGATFYVVLEGAPENPP